MNRLTRDGTAEPVSRDQILRRERGYGDMNFLCSADHVQDWQLYPIEPYSCYMCDHKSSHLPNVRVHSHVSLSKNKFWASKVMCRGSAADVLTLQGFCADPGIPPQMPQKGYYTHLVDFVRLSSMYKVVLFGGCSSRGLGGLLSKTAVSEAISGSRAVHTCCCFYCCMA